MSVYRKNPKSKSVYRIVDSDGVVRTAEERGARAFDTIQKYEKTVQNGGYLNPEQTKEYGSAVSTYIKHLDKQRKKGAVDIPETEWQKKTAKWATGAANVGNMYDAYENEAEWNAYQQPEADVRRNASAVNALEQERAMVGELIDFAGDRNSEAYHGLLNNAYELYGQDYSSVEDFYADKVYMGSAQKWYDDVGKRIAKANVAYKRNDGTVVSWQDMVDSAEKRKESAAWLTPGKEDADGYDPRFDEYSAKGAAIHYPSFEEAARNPESIGNIVEFARDPQNRIAIIRYTEGGKYALPEGIGEGVLYYHNMTDDEVATYNYYIGSGQVDKAQQYLDYLFEDLKSREGKRQADLVTGIDVPVIEDLAKLATAFNTGLNQWGQGFKQFFSSEELSPNVQMRVGEYVRQDIDSKVGQIAFDTASTIGNMAPSILLSSVLSAAGAPAAVASAAGSAALGVSASGNAYSDALQKGYDKETARTYSTLVGVAEGGLQYLLGGIGSLGGVSSKMAAKIATIDNVLLRVSAKLGTSITGEIVEEELQNYLEPLFRAWLFEEEYDAPSFDELLETAIVTALSTGLLEGGGTVISESSSAARDISAGKDVIARDGVGSLLELASDIGTKDVAKLAESVKKNARSGNVGRLYNAAIESVESKARGVLEANLMKNGVEKAAAGKIATVAANAWVGRDVGEAGMSLLAASVSDKNVAAAVEKTYRQIAPMLDKLSQSTTQSVETDTGAPAQQTLAPKTSTGEAVESIEVVSVGKNPQFRVNGNTVDAEGIALDEATGLHYQAVTGADGMSVEGANLILGNPKSTDRKFLVEALRTYQAGLNNDAAIASRLDAGVITADEARAIYKAAQAASQELTKQQQATINSVYRQAKKILKAQKKDVKPGEVTVDSGVEWSKMGETEVNTFSLASQIAVALGCDIEMFAGDKSVWGMYDHARDRIRININAEWKGNKMLVFALAHEMVHRAKAGSPAQFKNFANYLVAQYNQKGVNIEHLVQQQIDNAAEFGDTMSYDEALEEVVCDAAQRMLVDTNAGEVLAQFAEKKNGREIVENIINTIKEFFDNLRTIFAGMDNDNEAARAFKKLDKQAQQTLADMFVSMSLDAGEKLSTIKAAGIGEEILSTKDISYNRAAAEQHKADINERYKAGEAAVPLETLQKRYDKVLEMWDRIGISLNSEFLKEWNEKTGTDKMFNVFKAQSGYKYNIELSTMCKKGVALFEAIDTLVRKEIMNELDTKVLGKAEKEILYDVLKQSSFEIPCAICYVEQARQREGTIIDSFLNGKAGKLGWNQILDMIETEMAATGMEYAFANLDRSVASEKYDKVTTKMDAATQDAFYAALMNVANKEIEKYNKEKGKRRPLIKAPTRSGIHDALKGNVPANLKALKVLAENPDSRFRIDDDLLYSSLTTMNLAKSHQQLYSLFNSQGGVSGYKTKQTPIVYTGELLQQRWGSETVRKNGAIRNQSNSDLQMFTLLDQVQIYLDLTAKGYYLQAYTKVVAELKLFGLSKAKINASLIPKVMVYYNADGTVDVAKTKENAGLDASGNPIFDDIEGINSAEAFMVIADAEYSKSVGGVCIGYSNKHIKKLLEDNRVQMIIGYHDKTNDPAKRYRGAIYAENYNGKNEAKVRKVKDGKVKYETVHVNFSQFLIEAEKLFPKNKSTGRRYGEATYNGKVYVANDIPRLAADMYKAKYDVVAEDGTVHAIPAYAEFKDHANYYKLLADFSLYDSQGNYAPMEKVAFNMPDTVPYLAADGTVQTESTEAYIQRELAAEMRMRDDLAAKLADTSDDGIIPMYRKALKDPAYRESLANKSVSHKRVSAEMDASYMEAVNSGDTVTQERLVAEAAIDAGYPVKAYHGTAGFGFTDIDTSQSDDEISFFASSSFDVAQGYMPWYEDDLSDKYHDEPRRISDSPAEERISNKSSVDDVLNAVNQTFDNEYADARLATDAETLNDFKMYTIPEMVHAAESLLSQDVPESIKRLCRIVLDANKKNTFSAWAEVSKMQKEFDSTDLPYDPDNWSKHIAWSHVVVNLRSIGKMAKTEPILANGSVIGKDALVDKYNTSLGGLGVGVYEFYCSDDNQMVVHGNGSNWDRIPLGRYDAEFKKWRAAEGLAVEDTSKEAHANTREISEFAKAMGYRSVVFTDIYDSGAFGVRGELSDVYSFLYPKEDVKSADPVTYDDNGNVIPLSERFDPNKEDIRWKRVAEGVAQTADDVNKLLRQENDILRNDVEKLKKLLELQKTETHGTLFTPNSVNAAAKYIQKELSTSVSVKDIAKMLNGFYEYIASNEELTWEGVRYRAGAIVDELLSYRRNQKTDYSKAIWEHMRGSKIRLDKSQKAEAVNRYETMQEYRKALGSVVTIADNANMSLDSWWRGMAEEFPATFTEDISPGDMPLALVDIVTRLRNEDISFEDYGYDMALVRQEMIQTVYDSYWRANNLVTLADRHAKEINALKTKHSEDMRALRETHAANEDKLRKKHSERINKIRESHNKRLERQKIDRQKKRLKNMLDSKKAYVPVSLVMAVVDVCDMITTDTPLYYESGPRAGELNKAQQRRSEQREKLENLAREYEKMINDPESEYFTEYDEVVYEYLKEMRDKFADRNLRDMTFAELHEMSGYIKAITEAIVSARKAEGISGYETVQEASVAIEKEQTVIMKKRKNGKRSGAAVAVDSTMYLSMTPMRIVEKMCGYDQSSPLYQAFRQLELGTRKALMFTMESRKMFEKLSTGKAQEAYEKALYTGFGGPFKDADGRTFGISKMQMCQAILSMEREDNNKDIAHISEGGLAFADLKFLKKGDLIKASQEEHLHKIYGAEAVALVGEFRRLLKDDTWAQDYMAAAREFFDVKAKKTVNDAAIQYLHRIVAVGNHYIPYEVDQSALVRTIDSVNDMPKTINSYGLTQALKKKAPQPLIISGLNNVIDRHIEQVAAIHGLAVPVKTFDKIWNAKTSSGKRIHGVIAKNWGDDGVKVVKQAVMDIQAPRMQDTNIYTRMFRKVRSNYIGATFLLNLSVVSKQVASLWSAQAMLGVKNPVGMLTNLVYTMVNWKSISAEIDKHTAVAWARRQGVSDSEMKTLMTEGQKTVVGRFAKKAPAIVNPTKWITAMDSAAAMSLWKYCKAETQKKNKELKGEDLLKETAKYFEDVVENTQSMSDVLHRPEVQKNRNPLLEPFGQFKTDLYQMSSLMYTAFGRMCTKPSKENKLAFAHTLYAIGGAALWSQAMTVLFAFIRYRLGRYKDEEDEVTLASVGGRFTIELIGDMAGYVFPAFGSEIVDIIEGIANGSMSDVFESVSFSGINDVLAAAAYVLDNPGEATAKQWANLFTSVCQLFGMPAKNAYRILDSVRKYAKDISDGSLDFDEE